MFGNLPATLAVHAAPTKVPGKMDRTAVYPSILDFNFWDEARVDELTRLQHRVASLPGRGGIHEGAA